MKKLSRHPTLKSELEKIRASLNSNKAQKHVKNESIELNNQEAGSISTFFTVCENYSALNR